METKPEGFEEVYESFHHKIFLYVHKRISSREEAEDLTSEIFAAAVRGYPSYDPAKSSLATWLYLIANSRLRNYYRDRKAVALDISEYADLLPDPGEVHVPMEAAARLQNGRDAVAKALETLPERSRAVVRMRFFENRSAQEVGEALGLSAGNVRVIQARALAQMKKTIVESGVIDREEWGL